MALLNDLIQKFKGRLQQAQGKDQKQDSGIKGGFTEMKGKVNESIADWKLRRKDDEYNDTDI